VIKNNIVFDNVTNVGKSSCAGYEYASNFEQNPSFVNPDVSDPSSSVLPNLTLRPDSPAIDGGAPLTTVATADARAGSTLAVVDARYFQNGGWAPPGKVEPDTIAVGSLANVAKVVAIDYTTNVIVLSAPLTRKAGDPVWLARKSDGASVLSGSAPDFGAAEFSGVVPQAPSSLRIIR